MNTLFIGGSRHVSRLPAEVKERLANVISSGHRVIVGDANGADKAVQQYFHDAAYDKVTVFCSGEQYRNNLGHWETHNVYPTKHLKGFHFYAAKDREMAQKADFGLMIWDGKSPGTVLNVLRLVRAGKIAVLFNVPEKRAINIKSQSHWEEFLSQCSPDLRHDVRERATPEEWTTGKQSSLLKPPAATAAEPVNAHKADIDLPSDDLTAFLNKALAESDSAAVVDALGKLAKTHRMTQVAKDTGLARESLYRSLSPGGNPEFATVLKVLASLGFRLTANPIVPG